MPDPTTPDPAPTQRAATVGSLISVRSLEEARQVIAAAPDIVDLKEPSRGSLGAVDRSILEQVTGLPRPTSIRLSVAAGELIDWLPDERLKSRFGDALTQVDFIKFGLHRCATVESSSWTTAWLSLIDQLPSTTQPVLAGYLDWQQAKSPPVETLIARLAQQSRCRTLLLDTFEKSNDLFHWVDESQLCRWTAMAHRSDLRIVIAGSVNLSNVDRVLTCHPDLIGVRGAVTAGQREQAIDPQRLQAWLSRLSESSASGV